MPLNKPYLSICIPSYNSEPFLHIALDSLAGFDDRIEVLIVDDGSKDATLKVAQEYAGKYPFMRAIHQENKGHGGAINTAVSVATGVYFKVLDSDDWFDPDTLSTILDDLENCQDLPDMYISDYTYWQGYEHRDTTIDYHHSLPVGKTIPINDTKRLLLKQNFTLHSSIFRLELLKEHNIVLPEHTFYEDNYLVYSVMCVADTIRYIHKSLYQYLIGRDGQSMNRQTLLKRWKQIVLVSDLIFRQKDILSLKKTKKGLYRLLRHHLVLFFGMSPFVCNCNGSKEARTGLREFLKSSKAYNRPQYKSIGRNPLLFLMKAPGFLGVILTRIIGFIARRVVKFN